MSARPGPRSSPSAAATARRSTLRAARRYAGHAHRRRLGGRRRRSSGRLRELLNVVALGDIRKCLVALADEDSALAMAFEHRFEEGELAGHALGQPDPGRADRRHRRPRARASREAAPLLGAHGRGPAGHHRAGRAQGRVGQRHGGRARWPCHGHRRHPDGLAGARATPSRRPLRGRADRGGRPDRDRPRVAVHQRAGRRGGARHRRGGGRHQGPGRLRLQPAPADPRDRGLRRGGPCRRPGQARCDRRRGAL